MAGFSQQVLAELPHLTRKERTAIQAELEGHLADHAEALEAQGIPPEEARARAEAAMGDPAAVGKALAAQYSPFWLWMGRLAGACLALVVLLCAYYGYPRLVYAGENIIARIDPTLIEAAYVPQEGEEAWEVDVQATIGDQVLRIYGVSLDRKQGLVWIHCCFYNKNPFGYRSSGFPFLFSLYNQRGEGRDALHGRSRPSGNYFWDEGVSVKPGDTMVYYAYDRDAKDFRLEIPLEVTP